MKNVSDFAADTPQPTSLKLVWRPSRAISVCNATAAAKRLPPIGACGIAAIVRWQLRIQVGCQRRGDLVTEHKKSAGILHLPCDGGRVVISVHDHAGPRRYICRQMGQVQTVVGAQAAARDEDVRRRIREQPLARAGEAGMNLDPGSEREDPAQHVASLAIAFDDQHIFLHGCMSSGQFQYRNRG